MSDFQPARSRSAFSRLTTALLATALSSLWRRAPPRSRRCSIRSRYCRRAPTRSAAATRSFASTSAINVPLQQAAGHAQRRRHHLQSWCIDAQARTLTGVVTGLSLGENTLAAYANGPGNGRPSAQLTLVNHPIQGPVFSGPHRAAVHLRDAGLHPAGGARQPRRAPRRRTARIARRVDYLYRTTANTFAAWPAGATAYPANMARTTTTQGKNVPYIVRMETGTINRAIYQTTVLHDPLTEPAPTWTRRRPAGTGA